MKRKLTWSILSLLGLVFILAVFTAINMEKQPISIETGKIVFNQNNKGN